MFYQFPEAVINLLIHDNFKALLKRSIFISFNLPSSIVFSSCLLTILTCPSPQRKSLKNFLVFTHVLLFVTVWEYCKQINKFW